MQIAVLTDAEKKSKYEDQSQPSWIHIHTWKSPTLKLSLSADVRRNSEEYFGNNKHLFVSSRPDGLGNLSNLEMFRTTLLFTGTFCRNIYGPKPAF